MKEYMKNKNEYRIDGRLYVETINKCVCNSRAGNTYGSICRIIQRGERSYKVIKDAGFIEQGGKRLWLSENAKKTVGRAIEDYEKTIARLMSRPSIDLPVNGSLVRLYLEHDNYRMFTCLLDRIDENGERVTEVKREKDLHWLVCDISRAIRDDDEALYEILTSPDEKTIEDNPLYKYAVSRGDKLLAHKLKLYYRIATEEECGWLSKVLGIRVLPPLPAEYDKEYLVETDGINYDLLLNSGYTILHRPYFAMKGHTHSRWTLNPHTKGGVDAAKCGTEPITFSEYMELFLR